MQRALVQARIGVDPSLACRGGMTDRIRIGTDPAETWEILGRYIAGESEAAEAARVRQWLAEDPRRVALLTRLDAATRRPSVAQNDDLDVDAALARVHARMGSAPRGGRRTDESRFRSRWHAWPAVRIAAMLALVVGAGLVWRAARPAESPPTLAATTWTTPVGEVDSFRLPDGSRVVLGPDSRLEVDGEYGDVRRPVLVEGEARFDVTLDAARPFLVGTPAGATVVVLGTAFVVRTGMDGWVRVAVESGSVRFSAEGVADAGVVLGAGDRAILLAGGREPLVERGGVQDADLVWTMGRLVFDDVPVRHVAEELRRWYGVGLTWSDPAIASRRLSASFQGESASEVLAVVAAVLGLEIEVRGDAAVLHPRPGRVDL